VKYATIESEQLYFIYTYLNDFISKEEEFVSEAAVFLLFFSALSEIMDVRSFWFYRNIILVIPCYF